MFQEKLRGLFRLSLIIEKLLKNGNNLNNDH